MYPTKQQVAERARRERERELLRDQIWQRCPSTPTPADLARKEKLTAEGVEFMPDSCFHVIIYSTVLDEEVENDCKITGFLQTQMVQGHWGHVEPAHVRPGWHCFKITYDLRDLISDQTEGDNECSRRQICFALWQHFARAERRCLREMESAWEDHRTITRKLNDGRRVVVVKVEEWFPPQTQPVQAGG